MQKEKYLKILNEFMPSEQMRNYLSNQTLEDWQIADLIIGSPTSIQNKVQWLWGEDKIATQRAIDELSLKSGEIFYLTDAWYDDELKGEKLYSNSPFLSYKMVYEHIKDECEAEEIDINDRSACQWWILEKWSPNSEGGFSPVYTYFIFNGKIVYFIDENNKFDLRYSYDTVHLNLPIPYNIGDTLYIDCSPFAPPLSAMLTEKGDNRDCCCLQIVYRDFYTDKYKKIALKHGLQLTGVEGNYIPMISPLYYIKRINDDPFDKDYLKTYKSLQKARDFL